MKFASLRIGGDETWGLVEHDRVWRVSDDFARDYPTLRHAIAGDVLAAAAGAARKGEPLLPDEVEWLPVIPDAAKILCVGMNYLAHIREMGREPPTHPALFVRHADSLVGHGGTLIRPRVSAHYDFEGELALIIGRPTRYVTSEQALAHVAGYTCFMDGSVRDYQRHTSQFTAGKNFPASGAIGPWLRTADEVGDPREIVLQTRVSGEVMQTGEISDLCIGIPELIAYISEMTLLLPGDIIATGTPSGVGFARTPPRWLVAGDTVEVELSGVGVLRNTVDDE